MSITSTVSGALTSDLAKFAGKKFLESSFPQLYGLHKEYKGYKEERRKKETPENQKSEIQKNFESIDNEIKDTNVLLETEASIMGSQTVIMQQFLEEIKQIRKELLLGGGGGGGIGPKGGPKTKAPQPQGKVFGNAAEAKKAGGGKYYDKNGRLQEMKPKPGGGFTSTFAKNIPEAKPSFLSKAGSLAKGVLNFAGRIAAPLAIAGLAYDIHNTTKEGIEKKMNDPLNDPGSFNKLLSGLFGGSKKKISAGEEKQNLSILNYKASNSITFKSDELKINAQTIVMTEDMIKLLKDLDAKSEAERNAAADAQDRNTAVTGPGGIGDRLRGRPAPPGSPGSQPSANAGEAGKNLTTVTAKKSGKSDKVGSAYASNFQGFLDDLEATGYQIKTLGGFSFRGNKNNPSMLSYHGMGAALDVNAATNPFHTRQTDMPRNVGEIAKAHGLGWGISFEDPMHFSAAKREGGSFDIAQQRMPGYASGTPYVPQTGVATVGELGSETIVGKDGIKKTAAGAHTMMLRKGESVIPAGEKRSATEIAAEYKNAKAFASGTKPAFSPYVQKLLEDPEFKYNPRMQMGIRNLGRDNKRGAEGNIIETDKQLGVQGLNPFAFYTASNGGADMSPVTGVPKGASTTLGDYANKILIQSKNRSGFTGEAGDKLVFRHEVGHSAADAYMRSGGLDRDPELQAKMLSVTGDNASNQQELLRGSGEEARQRMQDLSTLSTNMTNQEILDHDSFIREYTDKGFNPETDTGELFRARAQRQQVLQDWNTSIDKYAEGYYPEQALRIPEGSSIHMLDTMGQYK
jgi:hypothetical protein